VKEKLTWSVDRSSPSNKIRDLMKWSKDILNDIYYQRKILSNPIATFFTKNWWVTHRVIHRMRLHLVPSSRLSNIHHKSNTVVQPNGLVDIQPLKKSIWRFLFISRRFLKLLTVAASISSCDRLFQFSVKTSRYTGQVAAASPVPDKLQIITKRRISADEIYLRICVEWAGDHFS